MIVKLVFLFSQLYAVFCLTKPETPCKVYDEACVTKITSDIFSAAVLADPKDSFDSIDPMHHDELNEVLPSLNFTLKDYTVIGLKNIQVQHAKVSDHDSVYITFLIPYYEMYGKYDINGNFGTTPLEGNGNFNVTSTNMKIDVEAMKHYYEKDGKVYIKIINFESITVEVLGKMHLNAENLFNGNKKLADTALQLLNSNDKVLAKVWSPPIVKANLYKLFININKILESISLEDIISEHPKVTKIK